MLLFVLLTCTDGGTKLFGGPASPMLVDSEIVGDKVALQGIYHGGIQYLLNVACLYRPLCMLNRGLARKPAGTVGSGDSPEARGDREISGLTHWPKLQFRTLNLGLASPVSGPEFCFLQSYANRWAGFIVSERKSLPNLF